MTKPSLFVGVFFCFATLCSPTVAEDESLRIFTLVNADSGAMADLLHTLSDGKLVLAEDRRTNSIVVKGTEEAMATIEAVLLKLDEAKEHKRPSDAEALEVADLEEQEQRILAKRIEKEKLRAQRKIEVATKRASMEVQLEFLKRRSEMVAAEAKLEQAVMEAEIKAAAKSMEALQLQLKMAKARQESAGGDSPEDIVMLEAELTESMLALEIQKMKLEFHMKHVEPMRQMEIEVKHHEHHRMLQSLRND